ncbi:MAG: hypothetical protein WC284_18335 [Candidimonas sp.]
MIVYRGSRNSRITLPSIGRNYHTFGDHEVERWGVFFTDNPSFAAMYGDVKKFIINPSSTFLLDGSAKSQRMIWNFIDQIEDAGIKFDAKNVHHDWQLFDEDVGEEFYKFLKSQGYDSVKFVEYNNDDDGVEQESNTYVMYDLNKIRPINDDLNQKDLFVNTSEEDNMDIREYVNVLSEIDVERDAEVAVDHPSFKGKTLSVTSVGGNRVVAKDTETNRTVSVTTDKVSVTKSAQDARREPKKPTPPKPNTTKTNGTVDNKVGTTGTVGTSGTISPKGSS